MRTVADWLTEYGARHEHPSNKLLHSVCVPPIVLSLLGILWSLPVPAAFADSSPWLNWATLAAAAALAYYLALSPALAVGALITLILLLLITHWLANLPCPLWLTSLLRARRRQRARVRSCPADRGPAPRRAPAGRWHAPPPSTSDRRSAWRAH